MKNQEKISVKVEWNYVKIYINDIIHVQFKSDSFMGFQSWVNGTNWYDIEFYLKDGVTIHTSYSSIDRWKKILQCLNAIKL